MFCESKLYQYIYHLVFIFFRCTTDETNAIEVPKILEVLYASDEPETQTVEDEANQGDIGEF